MGRIVESCDCGRGDAGTRPPRRGHQGRVDPGRLGPAAAAPRDAAGKAMSERMAAGGGLAGWLFGRWTYEGLLASWNARVARSRTG